MKKLSVIILVTTVLISSKPADAGEAWPWVVGGLAGLALISTATHDHDDQVSSLREFDHRKRPSAPVVVYNMGSSKHSSREFSSAPEPRHHREALVERPVYQRIKVWHPAFYDACGRYHRGYFTREYVKVCAY